MSGLLLLFCLMSEFLQTRIFAQTAGLQHCIPVTVSNVSCTLQRARPNALISMWARPFSRSLHTDRHNGRWRCMCALNVVVLYNQPLRLLATSHHLLVPSTGPELEVNPQSGSISWERVSTDSRRCGILLLRCFWPACWYLY